MNKHIENVQNLLALEQEIDDIAVEKGLATKEHTMIAERFVGGETRFVCTCGVVSKPARIKVTSKRIMRHTAKTGHIWVPANNEEQEQRGGVPEVSVQPTHEVEDFEDED